MTQAVEKRENETDDCVDERGKREVRGGNQRRGKVKEEQTFVGMY